MQPEYSAKIVRSTIKAEPPRPIPVCYIWKVKDRTARDTAETRGHRLGISRLPVRGYLAGARHGRSHSADAVDSVDREGSDSWLVGSGGRLHRLALRSQAEGTPAGGR